MVDYSDIPPDTIVVCPHCGAKNMRTDNFCRGCERSLDEVKKTLVVARPTWSGGDLGLQPRLVTMEELKLQAKKFREERTCGVCMARIQDWESAKSSYPCSFCGAPICRRCMGRRMFQVKDSVLAHLKRFGLEPFTGVKNDFSFWFQNSPPGSYYVLEPGYYLCPLCIDFMGGPGFFNYAKDYYEKTGRYEELAEIHELRGSLEDARRIRIDARTAGSEELNELIDKLREGGLAIPYKCPSCGANITVDSKSSSEGLRYCSYCGTALNTHTLVKALEASLH